MPVNGCCFLRWRLCRWLCLGRPRFLGVAIGTVLIGTPVAHEQGQFHAVPDSHLLKDAREFVAHALLFDLEAARYFFVGISLGHKFGNTLLCRSKLVEIEFGPLLDLRPHVAHAVERLDELVLGCGWNGFYSRM